MNSFTTSMCFIDEMDRTVEADVYVTYSYNAAEARTWDYPGCDAEVADVMVTLEDHDITEWLDGDAIDRIVEEAFDDVQSRRESMCEPW